MKIVITYGTFDLFHVGHIRLLERLKLLGDKLFVGVSTDEFNEKKGKKSFYSYLERAEIVQSCKFVDFVFPEDSWEQKVDDINKYNASIFAIGDDWKGKFDELNAVCEVVYLERTPDISTTKIKKNLREFKASDLAKIESSLHNLIEIVQALPRG